MQIANDQPKTNSKINVGTRLINAGKLPNPFTHQTNTNTTHKADQKVNAGSQAVRSG